MESYGVGPFVCHPTGVRRLNCKFVRKCKLAMQILGSKEVKLTVFNMHTYGSNVPSLESPFNHSSCHPTLLIV